MNVRFRCLVIYVAVFCRIIEPLASRCAKFRFKPLSEDIMITRVLHICQEEGLDLEPEVCISRLLT